MTYPSIGPSAINRAATDSEASRWSASRWRDPAWSVPPGITLPVTIVVSLALWAGMAYAVKSLFF